MPGHIKLKLLSLYLDERVGQKEKESVGSHLLICQACKERLTSLKATKGLLRAFPEIAESEGFDFEFRQRLDQELAGQEAAPIYKERLQRVLEGARYAIFGLRPVLVKAAALVTIIAFFAVSVFWNQIGVIPAIASVEGEVKIYSLKTNQWQDAVEGMRLNIGDIIKVGQNSQVNIDSRRYEILVKENTEVRAINLERPFKNTREVSYGLDMGKVLVATKKGLGGTQLDVESPIAQAKVKGTGFVVNVASQEEKNKTWVGVLNGEVEVISKMQLGSLRPRVLVEAGKATEVLPGSTPASPRYLLDKEWEEVQEIYRIGEQPQVALLVSMTPRRVHELLRPAAIYISGEKTRAMPRELAGIIKQVNKAIINKDKSQHLTAISSLEKLIEKYPSKKYDVQFLFFIAGYYYYVDEYQKAISALERIIAEYPGSNLISLALCAKGLIYEKGSKDASGAAIAYKAVLSSYPNSLEAEEAAAGLKRLTN